MVRLAERFPVLVSLLTPFLWWLAYPGSGGLWPLTFVMLVPLLIGLNYVKNSWWAALCGLCVGVVHYCLLLYWIINVISHYGGLPLVAAIPAFLLLVLAMSGILTLFCVFSYQITRHFPLSLSVWLIPALWIGLDWLRSFLFTGFPWMDPGYGLWNQVGLIQVADLTGHHGITFLLVLINVLLSLMICGRLRGRTLKLLIFPAMLIGAVTVYSTVRWQQVNNLMRESSAVRIGLVQGNISQEIKWSKERAHRTLDGYLNQSRSLIDSNKIQFIAWPETALPFYPKYHEGTLKLKKFVRENKQHLITGSPWFVAPDKDSTQKRKYYNSAILFDEKGDISGHYFKMHLVPFGEYVPFVKILFFVKPLVEAVGRFSSGEIEQPIISGPAKVGSLICFESIFPNISRKWVGAGANVLANLTNDAWYGFTSAPHHSLAMTVLRAIETRRSIVRVANTGFSGFIDPAGRLSHKSPLFQNWQKSDEVVLTDGKTAYVRFGFLFAPLCFTVGLFAWLITLVSRRRRQFRESS